MATNPWDESYLRDFPDRAIRDLLSWAFRRRPAEENEMLKQTAVDSYHDRQKKKEVIAMSETLGPTIEDLAFGKGEEKGKAEGKIEGKIEGELTARRDVLQTLLEERFGPLPANVAARIQAAKDLQRLKSACRQVLRMNRMDELEL